MDKSKHPFICTRDELDNSNYLVRKIQYKNRTTSAIVFQFQNVAYAYINHCMHMQRPLDCQEDTIFDSERKLLRCSMHGFVFEPTTGECLSPICAGQKLQSLKIVKEEQGIFFSEKSLTLVD